MNKTVFNVTALVLLILIISGIAGIALFFYNDSVSANSDPPIDPPIDPPVDPPVDPPIDPPIDPPKGYNDEIAENLKVLPVNDTNYFYIMREGSSEIIRLPIFSKKTVYTSGDWDFYENATYLDECYDIYGNVLDYLDFETMYSFLLGYNAFGSDIGVTGADNIIINLKNHIPDSIVTNISNLNYKIYKDMFNFDIHSYFPQILTFEMSVEKLKGETLYIYVQNKKDTPIEPLLRCPNNHPGAPTIIIGGLLKCFICGYTLER